MNWQKKEREYSSFNEEPIMASKDILPYYPEAIT